MVKILYGTMLIGWIVSLGLIIDSIINDKDKHIILLSQLYNFITGFFGYVIYFLSMIFLIKYAPDSMDLILALIISLIVLLLFFIPINKKCWKMTRLNLIKYICLSIFIAILGFVFFIVLSNILSNVLYML